MAEFGRETSNNNIPGISALDMKRTNSKVKFRAFIRVFNELGTTADNYCSIADNESIYYYGT